MSTTDPPPDPLPEPGREPGSADRPPERTSATRNPWLWATAVVAVVAIGLGVWALHERSNADDAQADAKAQQAKAPTTTTVIQTQTQTATTPPDTQPAETQTDTTDDGVRLGVLAATAAAFSAARKQLNENEAETKELESEVDQANAEAAKAADDAEKAKQEASSASDAQKKAEAEAAQAEDEQRQLPSQGSGGRRLREGDARDRGRHPEGREPGRRHEGRGRRGHGVGAEVQGLGRISRRLTSHRCHGRRRGCGRAAPRRNPLRRLTPRASRSHAERLPPQARRACWSRAPTAGRSSGQRWSSGRSSPVQRNPWLSRAMSWGSQSVCGCAPISTKSASAATVSSSPAAASRSTSSRRRPSPPPPTIGGAGAHVDVRRGLDLLDEVVRHPRLERRTAHNEGDATRIAREVQGGLPRRVPATRDEDVRSAERVGLRGRATVEDAGTVQRLERRDAEAAIACAGGEDHDGGADAAAVREREGELLALARERGRSMHEHEARSEDGGLLVRLLGQPTPAHPAWEAEVVADQRAGPGLSPDPALVDDERAQALGGAVDRRGQACRPGPHDDDVEVARVEVGRGAGSLQRSRRSTGR